MRAQSTVAEDQQALTVAITNLQLQQLLMKNALSRTLRRSRLAGAEVIPTSTMEIPESEHVQPTQDLVNERCSHRAELVESRIQLNSRSSATRQCATLCSLPSTCLPITVAPARRLAEPRTFARITTQQLLPGLG